ncbi:MAG: STN domain-containing protein [Pirellulaceae bacterium]
MSSRLAILAVTCLVVIGFGWSASPLSAEDAAKAKADSRPTQLAAPSEQRIAAALDRSGNWEFQDQPLTGVADFIQATYDIDVVIDRRALEDYGIGVDTPVTFAAQGMRLRSFLRHALRSLDLTWLVRDDALWITTPEEAEGRLSLRTYHVHDLIRVSQSPGEAAYDYDSLIGAIHTCIASSAWDRVGGPGTIEGIYGTLVVSQTEEIHDEISLFLAGYRKALRQQEKPDGPMLPIVIDERDGIDNRIRAALAGPITMEFVEEPLVDVAEFIADHAGITVLLDVVSLEDYGIDVETPVTANVKNISLRSALRRVLHDLDLTFVIRDEALVITTPEECEAALSIVLHQVHDLVSLASDPGGAGLPSNFDTLIKVITSSVQPDSWDAVGGPGSIVSVTHPPLLAISQTDDVHEEILFLIRRLRLAKQAEQKALSEPADELPPLVLHKTTQVYPLLLDAKGNPRFPAGEVLGLITAAIQPATLHQEKGLFALAVGNTIVVRHHDQVHREIQQLLRSIGAWNGFGGGAFGGGGMGGLGGGVPNNGGGSGGFF